MERGKNLVLFPSLLPEKGIYFLLDPILIVRSVGPGRFLENQATQVRQLIDKVEELADVVGYGRTVRIESLQMLFKNLADSFHALVDGFKVAVRPRLWLLRGLH